MGRLVQESIPNLLGGVSQQPEHLRMPSQAEEQLNAMATAVSGLSKRPPADLTTSMGEPGNQPFFHFISRDAFERYVVHIEGDEIHVYDLEGEEIPVTVQDGRSYLSAGSGDPRDKFRAVTVADFTFILNRQVEVEWGNQTADDSGEEGLIWVREGAYAQTYKVFIDDSEVASADTPDGDDINDAEDVKTSQVASDLAGQLQDLDGFNVTRRGSTILLRRTAGQEGNSFSLRAEASFGDGMRSFRKEAQRFSELPAEGIPGFQVEVVGDPDSQDGSYWVEFVEDRVGDPGTWKEIPEPGSNVNLDASTMPHVLVRKEDGNFTYREADWDLKGAGLSTEEFEPSFVGGVLNDIVYHRDRLCVLSGEKMITSRAGEYFNWFRETGAALLDSDPIDVGASHAEVSVLNYALPYNQDLYLFSSAHQFVMRGGDLLTPESAAINQAAAFPMQDRVRPTGAGRHIFFATERGDYTAVREYIAPGFEEAHDAPEITGHVPAYIASDAYRMIGSTNESMLVVLTDASPGTLWIYNFQEAEGELVQSAWSRWELGHEGVHIWDAEFIDSDLFLVVSPDGPESNLQLLRIPVYPLYSRVAEGLPVLLDWRVHVGGSDGRPIHYDEEDDVSHVYVPSSMPEAPVLVLTDTNGSEDHFVGEELETTLSDSQETVYFPGDLRGMEGYIGIPYTFSYVMTTPRMRQESQQGGMQAITSGRLQLRTLTVAYEETGLFEVRVSAPGVGPYRQHHAGPALGSTQAAGEDYPILSDGERRVPIRTEASKAKIEIRSDHWTPCHFAGAEWEGFYTNRARRL